MEFKFFDSICHAGKKTIPVPNIDYSASAVKELLRSVNVNKALFCPFESTEHGSIYFNEKVFEDWQNNDFFIPAFHLILNPGEALDGPGYFERFVEKFRPAIIYMFPNLYNYQVTVEKVCDYFDTADKAGIPVRIPSGSVTEKELSLLADTYKNITFIISDMGYSANINIPSVFKKHGNIYIDTTFSPAGGIEYIASEFGSERIVFASKAPEFSPAAPAGRIIMSGLTDGEKENVAYKNLERLTGRMAV